MAMMLNNLEATRISGLLNRNNTEAQQYMQQASTGMQINSARDDASAYAISEKMRVKIRAFDQANQNTQNDFALMKTAEGAVGNTVEILRTLKEKAIDAANDSNTDEDRRTIQKEFNQLIDQIEDNALITFNGKYLIDGSAPRATKSTATRLSNFSLDKTTTNTTKLTDLKNRAGDNLGIESSDKITASYIKDAKTYTTIFEVGNNTLEDIFNHLNNINDVVLNTELIAPTPPSRDNMIYSVGEILNSVTNRIARIEEDDTTSAVNFLAAGSMK